MSIYGKRMGSSLTGDTSARAGCRIACPIYCKLAGNSLCTCSKGKAKAKSANYAKRYDVHHMTNLSNGDMN
ncbi:MAG: hypothetical protein U0O18_02610 [Clostridia bacterium]